MQSLHPVSFSTIAGESLSFDYCLLVGWLGGSSNNHHHHFNLIVFMRMCVVVCEWCVYGQVFVCERYPLLLFVCLLLMHVFGFDSYC